MFGFTKRALSSSISAHQQPESDEYASSQEAGLVDEQKEKRFVRKLDWILVTWAFFAYLLKVSHFEMRTREIESDMMLLLGFGRTDD